MDFPTKNRLVEHLGKALIILPEDEHLRALFDKYSEGLFYVDDSNVRFSNSIIGIFKTSIRRMIDFDFDKYPNCEFRNIDNHEFADFFMKNMDQDLLFKKLSFMNNYKYNNRGFLGDITADVMNSEIKLFYRKNKEFLHIKKGLDFSLKLS